MKLFLDFLPLILFFGSFMAADSNAVAAAHFATDHLGFAVSGGVVAPAEAPVLLATVVVIVATLAQITLMLLARRKVDTMLWVTFALVVLLGGATVWFHNPTFIKWKPSALYWAMALALLVSQAMFGKNLLRSLIGHQLALPPTAWDRLNLAWIVFFTLAGFVNIWVAYNFSTSTWVSFKAFGLTGLLLLFMIAQGFYMARHVLPEEEGVPLAGSGDAPAAAERERR
ncbi:MAG: septation protein A [Caldimonas sp.]